MKKIVIAAIVAVGFGCSRPANVVHKPEVSPAFSSLAKETPQETLVRWAETARRLQDHAASVHEAEVLYQEIQAVDCILNHTPASCH